MSLANDSIVVCPVCQRKNVFTYWGTIDVAHDPELKKLVCNGDLFRLSCQHCAHTVLMPHNCIYHDPEKELLISLECPDVAGVVDRGDEGRVPILGFANGRVFRTVTSLPDLVEKIYIFDRELSDVFIEFVKLFITLREQVFWPEAFRFADVRDRWFGEKQLVFLRGPVEQLKVHKYDFSECLDMVSPIIQELDGIIGRANMEWPVVDRSFVMELLERSGLVSRVDPSGIDDGPSNAMYNPVDQSVAPEKGVARLAKFGDKVKVYTIGKGPEIDTFDGLDEWIRNGQRTFRTLIWRVGKDISVADTNELRDATTGCLYIAYGGDDDDTKGKFVSRDFFKMLKAIEDR